MAIPLRQLHISHAIQQRMFSAPESRTGALVKLDSAPLALAQALGLWDLPSNCARTRTAESSEHRSDSGLAFELQRRRRQQQTDQAAGMRQGYPVEP